jgi:rifampicin phosphotransferase
MTPPSYEAPGPGTWEQDSTHFPRPLTPFVAEVFPEPFKRGFMEGTARYGLLFSHLEPAVINGFMYNRMDGVAPDEEEEVGRRFGAAQNALESKIWRQDLEIWDREYKPDSIRRNEALQTVDVTALDTEGLIAHLAAVRENAAEMVYRHHKFTIGSIIPVGLYLSNTMRWTGMDAGKVLAPLKGSSPVSLGALEQLRSLARALEESGTGPEDFDGASAQDILDALAGREDAVGEATRDFLSFLGLRLAGGYDIADPCAVELPEMLLGTIWSELGSSDGAPDGSGEAEERVRAAVPAEHRDRFDELLHEARLMNRLRDERGIYNDNWGSGIARKAILEAGRRLAASGRIDDAQSALDATCDELDAMLRGSATPPADELAARTHRRLHTPLTEAPPFLGPEPAPPPPPDGLPPHVAEMMGALGVAIGEVFAHGPRPSGPAITGRAVSPGAYTGTARVLGHPDESNRIRKGDVLVTGSTSAAFNVVLPLLGAIVTDRGGQLSHAAIVAREFGIPAVVGTSKATALIPDGARVRVDGTAGTVELV